MALLPKIIMKKILKKGIVLSVMAAGTLGLAGCNSETTKPEDDTKNNVNIEQGTEIVENNSDKKDDSIDSMELKAVMEKILEGVENLPMYEIMELTPDNFDFSAFIPYVDGYEGVSADGLITSIPHSVVLVRVPDGTDASVVADEIKTNADPRKWICVGAEATHVRQHGNTILLVMSSAETANQILMNFDALAGKTTPESDLAPVTETEEAPPVEVVVNETTTETVDDENTTEAEDVPSDEPSDTTDVSDTDIEVPEEEINTETDTETVVENTGNNNNETPESVTGDPVVNPSNTVTIANIVDAMKNAYGEDYLPSMEMDKETFNATLKIDDTYYTEFYGAVPMIGTHVDKLFIVKTDDTAKMEEVFKSYMDEQLNAALQYPMNLTKLENYVIETHGDYVVFFILGGYTDEMVVDDGTSTMEELDAKQKEIEVTYYKSMNELGSNTLSQLFGE